MTTATTPADSFTTWIATATSGLCADAVTRIRDELLPHYEDTVEHLIREGADRDEAEAKAVQQLGNPRKARRGFRRANLTTGEQIWLDWLAWLPSFPLRFPGYAILASFAFPFVLAILVSALIAIIDGETYPFRVVTGICAMFAIVSLALYLFAVPIGVSIRRGNPRFGVAVYVAYLSMIQVLLLRWMYVDLLDFPGVFDPSDMLQELMLMLIDLVWLVKGVRLFRKLRRGETVSLGRGSQ